MRKECKIAFIGAGNVATNLALTLYEKGYTIPQVYSRTNRSAELLAKQVGALHTNNLQSVLTDADIYIFSVKDSVLPDILSGLPKLNGLLLHTAGSLPMDIFAPYSSNYGVIYPLQTFTKSRGVDFSTIPVFIEAAGEKQLALLHELADSISSHVYETDSERRRYLHLSAVFACNFVNRMYDIGSQLLQQSGLPFDVLLPLIDETAAKAHTMPPFDAQTGPAIRYDKNVMDKHLSLIQDEQLKGIYELISDNIHQRHKNNE